VLVPTVFAPSRKGVIAYVLLGVVLLRVIISLVASLTAIASGLAHWSLLPAPNTFTVSPLFPLSMLVAMFAAWRGRADALAAGKR